MSKTEQVEKLTNYMANFVSYIGKVLPDDIIAKLDELESLIRAKKKVVIVTDQPVNFRNARVYIGNNRGMQIGVITDSRYVLTGEYGEGSINTCLYSGQKNFVELYKSALSNEIKLLAIREENMQ